MKTNANHTNANANANKEVTNMLDTIAANMGTAIDSGITNEKRASYTFGDLTDSFVNANVIGSVAFLRATLEIIVAALKGHDEEIISAKVNHKDTKRGHRLEVIFETVNYKTVYVTTNTTAALDTFKIMRAYLKKCANRRAKAIEDAKPENVAKRDAAKASAKTRNETRRYYRNLIKHGMSVDDAKVYALTYAAEHGNDDATMLDDIAA